MKVIEQEIAALKNTINEMWALVHQQIYNAGEAMLTGDKELAYKVLSRERRVNAFELKIDSDCEDIIALYAPVAIDLRFVLAMYITVTMKEVDELVACGVDILAVQGTAAIRPDGSTSAQFIRAIKAKYPDQLLMADCDNFENAMLCAEAGADFVGTTMRGYTPETQGINDIDFEFVHKLAAECPAKIIAEGHIHYPEQAVKALEAGAFALVVGGAITRPAEITARFTGAINAMHK